MEGLSFDDVVRAHGGMIRRIAALRARDPAKCEELEQDILTTLWRALPRYRGEASLRTFIGRVAHNRALTFRARELARPATLELDEGVASDAPTPFDVAERRSREASLLAAIRTLPPGMREPVALTLEGMTPQEIAEVLGTNVNTVSIRLTRAKALLKPFFAAHRKETGHEP